jgi:hypothetical protein
MANERGVICWNCEILLLIVRWDHISTTRGVNKTGADVSYMLADDDDDRLFKSLAFTERYFTKEVLGNFYSSPIYINLFQFKKIQIKPKAMHLASQEMFS